MNLWIVSFVFLSLILNVPGDSQVILFGVSGSDLVFRTCCPWRYHGRALWPRIDFSPRCLLFLSCSLNQDVVKGKQTNEAAGRRASRRAGERALSRWAGPRPDSMNRSLIGLRHWGSWVRARCGVCVSCYTQNSSLPIS